MTAEEIKQLVLSGEGFHAEFKISAPSKLRDLSAEVCAFANSAGGTVLIGVDDSNIIKGVSIDNRRRSSIQDSIREISPSLSCNLEIVDVDGKDVGVIVVKSGHNKPYVLSGAIYVRNGSNTQKLTTAEEMRDFFQQADKIYFDEMPCKGFNTKSDIDEDCLNEFRSEAAISSSISNDHLLQNLRLYTDDGLFKSGATLFFGKNPETYFDLATVRCIAYDGTNKRYIADDKTFTGPLYTQFKQALAWLKRKLDVSYNIEGAGSGPRIETWEIPETALKEAIVNALSHRDYYDRGNRINIELFDDRIEITNPGGLVSAIPEADFGKKSYSRNPLIFGLFEKMRMVEHIGSGIMRMKELMKDAGLPQPVFQYSGMFSVSFYRPIDFNKWIKNWREDLTENRLAILIEMHKNNVVTIKELEGTIGISDTAIENNIDYLKNNGFLERVGGDKGGRWLIQYKSP